jgi:hypothetical protein
MQDMHVGASVWMGEELLEGMGAPYNLWGGEEGCCVLISVMPLDHPGSGGEVLLLSICLSVCPGVVEVLLLLLAWDATRYGLPSFKDLIAISDTA